MVVPRRWAARPLAALLGMLVALGLAAGGTAGAEPADDPLAGTFADVALVTSPEGEPGAALPRLLVARAPDPTDPGTIVLDLLQADGDGWARVDRLAVATGLDEPGSARLIPLNGRFAILATDLGGKTYVGLIAESPIGLRQTAAEVEVLGRVAAGAADIDGDGSDELVLVGDAVPDGTGGCLWSPLVVMSGVTLASEPSRRIPGIGLDGGAIGHFGTSPGEDLLAYTHDSCVPEPFAPSGVAVIDLATGELDPSLKIHTYRSLGESSYVGPGRIDLEGLTGPIVPLVADLDGDGVDEAILRSGPAVVVLDPAQGWRAEVVDEDATPLAVVDPADRPRLVVAKPAEVGASAGIRLVALGRVGRGGELIRRGLTAVSIAPDDPTAGMPPAVELATDPAAQPPAWFGALGQSGCRAVLVPAATFLGCPGHATQWSGQVGPAWLQTVPLTEVGTERLLVAAGVGWTSAGLGLAVPDPAAGYAARSARWRTGPSSPFALVVTDAQRLVGTDGLAKPAMRVDPDVGRAAAPTLRVAARPGARILVRVGPVVGELPDLSDESSSTAGSTTIGLGDFLLTPPSAGNGSVLMVPVSGPVDRAAPEAVVTYGLPVLQEFPTTAWSVTLLGLNEFGEPSAFRAGRVALDVIGPSVTVEQPFGSAPWPLHASISGTAEAGARIRLRDGAFVDTSPDGSFRLDAVLAPWPQDLVLEATDAHGNLTTTTVNLVGGIDYRQLPWQPLVIGVVLAAALVTTLGGPSLLRRRRAASPLPSGPGIRSADDPLVITTGGRGTAGGTPDELAEIEDLPRSRPGIGR